MTRLLLVDPHPLFRRSIQLVIESHPEWYLQGQVSNGLEALAYLREHGLVDVILVDRFPSGDSPDGLDVAALIRRQFPAVEVVLLAEKVYPSVCLRAQRVGVKAVVAKHRSHPELPMAIRAVLQGQSYGCESVPLDAMTSELGLTVTERSLIRAIRQGKDWEAAALLLRLRKATVSHYRRVLMAKLDVGSEQHLQRAARKLVI